MKHIKSHDIFFYLLEIIAVGGAFVLLLTLDLSILEQMGIMLVALFIYALGGIMHHKLHHDLHPKIFVEYVLISLLAFTLFIFLNIVRI